MPQGQLIRRLQWQPVQHACAHYEARLMAHVDQNIASAGSPCSSCAPQGRPVQPSYTTVADVLTVCRLKNVQQGRVA